jgi:Ca2+:H+ antiporter
LGSNFGSYYAILWEWRVFQYFGIGSDKGRSYLNSEMTGVNSHLEMGSVKGISGFDFPDETTTLVSPAPANKAALKKIASLDSTPNLSFQSVGSANCHPHRLFSTAFKSIRVAFFSNKINLLVPLGPLAILLHNLTRHQVSCNILK